MILYRYHSQKLTNAELHNHVIEQEVPLEQVYKAQVETCLDSTHLSYV